VFIVPHSVGTKVDIARGAADGGLYGLTESSLVQRATADIVAVFEAIEELL
jgi:hypothetical protein